MGPGPVRTPHKPNGALEWAGPPGVTMALWASVCARAPPPRAVAAAAAGWIWDSAEVINLHVCDMPATHEKSPNNCWLTALHLSP